MIVESFGRFKATAYEDIAAGDLCYFDTTAEEMYVADAEDSMPAQCVALEDIADGDEGWFALAALVRKPPTASTSARGAVTRADHSGTPGTLLYLDGSADQGEACESAGTIPQQVGFVTSQDEAFLIPMGYLTGVNIAASGTLDVTGNSSLGGTLAVTGAVTLTASLKVGTTLEVVGATTQTGALAINGGATVATGKTLTLVKGNVILTEGDVVLTKGSVRRHITAAVDSAYSVLDTDDIVVCTLTAGRTVTLPTAVAGRAVTIVHSSGDFALVVDPNTSDKIISPADGVAKDHMTDDKGLDCFLELVALDATNWRVTAFDGDWTPS
jgi:hypothetical protein